jgi:hypothetical protein
MGKIKGSKAHAIVVQDDSIHQNHKSKNQEKSKSTQNPSIIPSDPKVQREEKWRN